MCVRRSAFDSFFLCSRENSEWSAEHLGTVGVNEPDGWREVCWVDGEIKASSDDTATSDVLDEAAAGKAICERSAREHISSLRREVDVIDSDIELVTGRGSDRRLLRVGRAAGRGEPNGM
jgi:hypothetical protein